MSNIVAKTDTNAFNEARCEVVMHSGTIRSLQIGEVDDNNFKYRKSIEL